MLQLATTADRASINDLASQVHALHIAWRPDIYAPADEMYPQDRFWDAVKQRQLYVAKIGQVTAGYCLLKIREYNGPGHVFRKVMVIDEFCVDAFCRRQGIGTEMMEDVRALARAFRCTDLQLGVYPQNDESIAC